MDSRTLGILVVAMHAHKAGGSGFAAVQRHGLENPLVAEGRLLIGLFTRRTKFDFALISFAVLLGYSHTRKSSKNCYLFDYRRTVGLKQLGLWAEVFGWLSLLLVPNY
jgi:hypothetical protein